MRLIVYSTLFCLVTLSSQTRGDFIVNGGFEQPVVPLGSYTTLNPGSMAFVGWTISGSIDLVNAGYFPSFEQAQSVALDAHGSNELFGVSAISQSFGTVIGTRYTLSFAYANNPDGSSAQAFVSFPSGLAGIDEIHELSHGGSTRSSMNYNLFSVDFTANSTTSRIRFVSTSGRTSPFGIVLDAVSVLPASTVPEPSSLSLSGIAALSAGLGYRWRKRRGKVAVRPGFDPHA